MKTLILTQNQVQCSYQYLASSHCIQHKGKISGIGVKGSSGPEVYQQSEVIPLCNLCSQQKKYQARHSLKDLFQFIRINALFQHKIQQKTSESTTIKDQMIEILKSKKVRLKKYVSFFQALTRQSQQFLKSNSSVTNCESRTFKCKVNSLQGFYLAQSKKWMKDPQSFETSFHLQMSRQNLAAVLSLKFTLVYITYCTQQFFRKSGIVFIGNSIEKLILQSNHTNLRLSIQRITCKKNEQILNSRMVVLKQMKILVRMQQKMQQTNQYITEFIKLYASYNDYDQQTRFYVTEQTFQYFNFDIALKTVVLRNPNLLRQVNYQEIPYESQFTLINDGQFIFKNEYRPNIFCEENINPERSNNTMIGREFYTNNLQISNSSEFQGGKQVKINRFLGSEDKIYLRLRLNAEEFDKVTIRFTWSDSFDNFFQENNEFAVEVHFLIVPDSGDNSITYGFRSGPRNTRKNVSNKRVNDRIQEQQIVYVLQDDIISFTFNDYKSQVVIKGQTRKQLIKSIKIERNIIKITQNLQFEAPIAVFVVLYSTIPEIQIFQSKRQT